MKTVNFIEAVNSGKRFRPVNWVEAVDGTEWYSWYDKQLIYSNERTNEVIEITKEILCWEYTLEEKKITITESEFNYAVERVYASETHLSFIQLKKELGF